GGDAVRSDLLDETNEVSGTVRVGMPRVSRDRGRLVTVCAEEDALPPNSVSKAVVTDHEGELSLRSEVRARDGEDEEARHGLSLDRVAVREEELHANTGSADASEYE